MTRKKAGTYLLAGDIGGTKTTLALYDAEQGPLAPVAEKTVQNETAADPAELIAAFLADREVCPQFACFGVAGPVMDNRVRMTNLDWFLDGDALQQRFGMQSVTLINDLVAAAMGAVQLPPECLFTLNAGRPDREGAIAVIAPGTGLGQAFLVHYRHNVLPFPSEGGHSSFAPVNDLQTRLLHFMLQDRDHVSAEQVCSGIGIPHLYDFLRAEEQEAVRPPASEAGGDRTKTIVEAALAGIQGDPAGDPTAVRTLELFATLLASEAANLVLKVLATGGIFLGGGLPPRILPFLRKTSFMHAFCRGVHREMLANVPVHVILEPKTALIGAAAYALAGLDNRVKRQ